MQIKAKKGIALLITLMFIISITAAIGVSLMQVNKVQKSVLNETFIVQTSILLDDVMNMLKTSKELAALIDIEDEAQAREAFYIFLEQAAFIPFESSGIEVLIEMSSARSKFNPNSLLDYNTTSANRISKKRIGTLIEYLNMKGVDSSYADILLDSISGVKEDFSYYSDIFTDKPYLFRDYISSQKHLDVINTFYLKAHHNIRIKDIDSEKLFYYTQDLNNSYTIDFNHVTKETLELLLLCDKNRAEQLAERIGVYSRVEDMLLTDEEAESLENFKISPYEPFIDVKIEFIENGKNAIIRFEYDIETRKGSNFVYEI